MSTYGSCLHLCVYLRTTTGGQTFEEYISLADYEAKNTGELSVRAGEIVRVISREATGEPNQ